jgi:hypothetical protein
MDELIKLSEFITDKKLSSINIFNKEELNTKENILFNAITKNGITTDEDACYFVYGNKKKGSTYRQLKFNLRKKLLNTIIFIDTSGPRFTERRKAYYDLCRMYCQYSILSNSYNSNISISLGEKTVKKALFYEYYNFVNLISRELIRHFGYEFPSQKKFEYYSQLLKESKEILDAEFLVDEYYVEISRAFFLKKEINLITHKRRLHIIDDNLKALQRKIKSLYFNIYASDLIIFNHIINYQFKEALDYIEEIAAFFEKKPFNTNFWKFILNSNKYLCFINLEQIDQALIVINENLNSVKKGFHNWFKIKNYEFVCCVLNKDYNNALRITFEVLNQPTLIKYKTHHELWKIKAAYMHFMMRIGIIEVQGENGIKDFRLYKFLNEVPYYSKNKHGLNTSILIIQMLFLIQMNKHSILIDKIESLKQYTYRYLNTSETIRTNSFIKILLCLPKANFNSKVLEQKSKRYINRLYATKYIVTQQISEVEIIPFENLLEILFELLEGMAPKRQRRSQTKKTKD